MKQLTFFSLALLLAACSNQNSSTPSNQADGVETTPPGNDGVKMAITVFAEWQRGGQGNVDGEYDSQESMFVPCGSEQGVAVNSAEIKIISGGNCGGQLGKMEPERLIVVNRSGNNFKVISRDVTLKDVTHEKGAGQYQTSTGAKQIVVDKETLNRIKTRPVLMQKVQQR